MLSKEILDELWYLNSHINEKNDTLYGVSYQTNGWYESIMFNEHVLWDSDDNQGWLSERPDFDEEKTEDDHDPDVIACVKRRFNQYVDSLQLCKFDTP